MKTELLKVKNKIPTGIEGFEYLTMGGLIEGRTTLLVGTSGAGKTIFVMEFLYRSVVEFNRGVVLVTFEERPKEIISNVAKLNWDINKLIENKKFAIIDASAEPVEMTEVGSYDLSGLFIQIKEAVKQTGATVVALDSIAALFSQFSDTRLIRHEIFRIIEELRSMNITALLTAERLEEYGPITRHGVEEFVSDNVIILRNVLEEEKCRRTIQILKVRGDTHLKGEYPFTISDTGLNIMPLSAMQLKQSSSSERISMGNKKLDEMTSGGIFRDSVFLVSGPTGGGKTLMSSTFAAEGCRENEKVLLLAYEESRQQLLRNSKSWGFDFEGWEEKGLLKIVCLYPEAMGLEDHLLKIRREIEAFKPRRLVLDSVSAMERVSSVRNFREFVIGLTSFVKQEGICSLFTSTTPNLSGGESITEAHISTITDIIALIRYVEKQGFMRRGIAIIKMRGSQHEKVIREFTIDAKGMHVGEPFKNVQNIILGIPSSSGPSESDNLEGMF
jgi:circadian clock protein KaiC